MDGFYYHGDIEFITEILKNRLYFAVLDRNESIELQSSLETFYFCTDNEYVYLNFYHDFGPLNISCLYKYCCKLNQFLKNPIEGIQRFVHYSSKDPHKKANASFLIGSYAILYLNMDPKEVYQRLYSAGGIFKPFVDASQGPSPYTISIMDCFRAIKKCSSLNFFNFEDFSVAEYDNHDKLVNGDINWLVPRKFLAFIGPTEIESTADCFNGHNPSFYIDYFINNDVRTVIRLNNRLYNESVFIKAGIEHYDMFFPDGTIPPKHILLKFLTISEHAPAAIAVHCKAGLGRTGSLIGAFIIKHYHLTAREAIAWMRICRPGSVIGPQQDWLEKIEKWLWKQGCHYRSRHFGDGDKIPFHKYGIYSIRWMNEHDKAIREARVHYNNVKKDTGKRKSVCDEVNQMSTQNKVLAQKQSIERKKMLLNQKEEELRRLSNLLYKVQTKEKTRRRSDEDAFREPPVPKNSPVEIGSKLRRSKTAALKRGDRDTDIPLEYLGQVKRRITTAINNRNSVQNHPDVHSFDQIAMTPLCSSMRTGRRRNTPEGHRKQVTQGDKLNEIKAKRFMEKMGSAKPSRPQQDDVGIEKKPGRIASNILKKLPIIQRSRRGDMIA